METFFSTTETFTKTTNGVKVSVVAHYIDEQSDPEDEVYVFAYTITIENQTDDVIQLLNRHWIVFSGEEQCADVKGEGVVGEQPVLVPGEAYRYTSGTSIHDPVGVMHGSYTFQSENNDFFDVEIPRFELVCTKIPEMLLN
ncbi:MAG: Co2+/Mg2+ efflux protein ApaG [Deltaproteobacteria bacterium]|nr:Co2+/Mg2+ efflux protein ApaG [Deltaproteobacteria bacterium]